MKDENGNIVDSEEVGGRVAIDAVSGALSDYLQDLLDHEPIEPVDLADEIAESGEDVKVVDPKITEDQLEGFVKQKISGSLRADKENVSVAGFEVLWSPVYRYWMTVHKKTHNLQIDACGGYPVNYDDIPIKPKTWSDRVFEDLNALKDPRKWNAYLKKRRTSAKSGGKGGKPNTLLIEALAGIIGLGLTLYGMSNRNTPMFLAGLAGLFILFWYTNHRSKKPLIRLPAPPYAGPPPK